MKKTNDMDDGERVAARKENLTRKGAFNGGLTRIHQLGHSLWQEHVLTAYKERSATPTYAEP